MVTNGEFIWALPEAGHFVTVTETPEVESRSREPRILPKDHSAKTERCWRKYAPLQSATALFRIFADLDCTQESIVTFADQFGLLEDPEGGEPLAAWKGAITEMRSAVQCWEEARREAAKPLRRPLPPRTARRIAAMERERLKLVEQLGSLKRKHGVEHRDEEFLPRGVSESLSKWEPLALKINQNISDVRPVLTFGLSKGGLSLQLMPTNLLEAMWLQFGQAVESDKAFQKCPQCDTWFEISSKAGRFDKVFCSGACKAKAYRERLSRRHDADLQRAGSAAVAGQELENPEGTG